MGAHGVVNGEIFVPDSDGFEGQGVLANRVFIERLREDLRYLGGTVGTYVGPVAVRDDVDSELHPMDAVQLDIVDLQVGWLPTFLEHIANLAAEESAYGICGDLVFRSFDDDEVYKVDIWNGHVSAEGRGDVEDRFEPVDLGVSIIGWPTYLPGDGLAREGGDELVVVSFTRGDIRNALQALGETDADTDLDAVCKAIQEFCTPQATLKEMRDSGDYRGLFGDNEALHAPSCRR